MIAFYKTLCVNANVKYVNMKKVTNGKFVIFALPVY